MTTPTELRSKLQGVIAFPITPFHEDLSLNLEGLRHNLTKLREHPLCAVVAAGGTGEVYSLTPAEYEAVVRLTVEVIDGAAPIIAGVGFNQPMAVEMAKQAAAAGVDGILALPPYYPNADDEGMLSYSRDMANFSPAMVDKLASNIPTLCAWKDGQADIRRYQMIINRLGDRLHWIGGAGDDSLPGYYSIGIRTYTSSIATVAPKLSLKLHEVGASENCAELMKLMYEYVTPLYALRARRKGYEVSAMKAMMDMVGLAGGPVRPPLPNVKPEEKEELRIMLEKWKPFL